MGKGLGTGLEGNKDESGLGGGKVFLVEWNLLLVLLSLDSIIDLSCQNAQTLSVKNEMIILSDPHPSHATITKPMPS